MTHRKFIEIGMDPPIEKNGYVLNLKNDEYHIDLPKDTDQNTAYMFFIHMNLLELHGRKYYDILRKHGIFLQDHTGELWGFIVNHFERNNQ